jgi:hypothetical protein
MIEIRTKDADEAAFYWAQDNVFFAKTECKEGYSKKILWFIFESNMTES